MKSPSSEKGPEAAATFVLLAQEWLHQAVGHHQRGELDQAEAGYRQVLEAVPGHFDARHLLGVVCAQRKDFVRALEHFDQAARLRPGHPALLVNRGSALLDLERPAEALASYDAALATDPARTDFQNLRATALRALKRNEESLGVLDQALARDPNNVALLKNRARTLAAARRAEEALTAYDAALEIDPSSHELTIERGAMLLQLKQPAAALAVFDAALETTPASVLALQHRGNALRALQRPEEALAAYDAALQIDPRHVPALTGRAATLRELGRVEEALGVSTRTLDLKPGDPDLHLVRGNLLQDLNRHEDAIASYDRALGLDPEHLSAIMNRAHSLGVLGRRSEALHDLTLGLAIKPDQEFLLGSFVHAKMQLCTWDGLQAAIQLLLEKVDRNQTVVQPFALLATEATPAQQRKAAASFATHTHPAKALFSFPARRHGERIRVGYFSPDFRNHAVSYLSAGLFERHDRKKFEITGFFFGPKSDDAMARRIGTAFDRSIDIRAMPDVEVVRLARDLQIDIAVDLCGFTAHARTDIFAARAAPIQINYLGYPGTMGAEYMDYIVGDRMVVPEEERAAYAERVIYLPDTFQVNDVLYPIDDAPSRRNLGLPESAFVFCSFNNSYKLHPTLFLAWLSVLERVEDAVLWLVADDAAQRENLRRSAQSSNVDPDRILFAPRVSYSAHLARYQAGDLVLDSWPFNGGTTTSDALRAGVLVLTYAGKTFASRMSASLLHALGLDELVTGSLEGYRDLAVALAHDRTRLARLRAALAERRNSGPVFDPDRFARNLESAFSELVARSRVGLSPEDISVQPRPRL